MTPFIERIGMVGFAPAHGRDDVSGLAIRKCVQAAGAEIYETTSCYV